MTEKASGAASKAREKGPPLRRQRRLQRLRRRQGPLSGKNRTWKQESAKSRAAKSMVQAEYVAKLDSKKRITVRSARSEYYAVTELSGGVIVLKPQEAFTLADLPQDVLDMIDQASANFKAGRVLPP